RPGSAAVCRHRRPVQRCAARLPPRAMDDTAHAPCAMAAVPARSPRHPGDRGAANEPDRCLRPAEHLRADHPRRGALLPDLRGRRRPGLPGPVSAVLRPYPGDPQTLGRLQPAGRGHRCAVQGDGGGAAAGPRDRRRAAARWRAGGAVQWRRRGTDRVPHPRAHRPALRGTGHARTRRAAGRPRRAGATAGQACTPDRGRRVRGPPARTGTGITAERRRETAPRKSTNPGRRRPGSGIYRDCGTGLAPGLLGLDFLGLQALLALHDLERHLLSFLQRLEATALDGTEVHEQVGTALRGDEAEALGIVEPLDGAGLTLRHGVTPWISWGCTAAQEAWPDCIEQGVTRSDGADRPERPSSTWRL